MLVWDSQVGFLPDNSYASIMSALDKHDSDGVEVDIHLSKDGRFVLYHDRELDTKTDITGCIPKMKWEEIKNANYKVGFPFDLFHNEKLITLDSLIDNLKEREEFPYVHLDLRLYSTCFTAEENKAYKQRFIRKLDHFLNANEVPKEKILLIIPDKEVVKEAMNLGIEYPIGYEITDKFNERLQWAKEKELDTIVVKRRLLSPERTKQAHEAGIEVVTFSARSRSGNKELLSLNPDMVHTDNLKVLERLLTN